MSGNVTTELLTKSVKIDSNLDAKEYYFVNFDASDDNVVNIAAAATAVPFILTEGVDGSSTEGRGTIVMSGISKLKLGGTVAAGDKLTSNASGVGIVTTTDTNNYGALALKAGVSGDIIEVSVERGMIAG